MTNDECWLCRIAWFCKCQSHFRLSLILFCLLPLVSSDGENKSAEERAKLVISINLLSRSHLEVKQQFSKSIYRKVTAQVRKQAILTDRHLQFSISGRWDFHRATPVCSGLDRNASSRQQKRSCRMHDNFIQEANGDFLEFLIPFKVQNKRSKTVLITQRDFPTCSRN